MNRIHRAALLRVLHRFHGPGDDVAAFFAAFPAFTVALKPDVRLAGFSVAAGFLILDRFMVCLLLLGCVMRARVRSPTVDGRGPTSHRGLSVVRTGSSARSR